VNGQKVREVSLENTKTVHWKGYYIIRGGDPGASSCPDTLKIWTRGVFKWHDKGALRSV